MFRVVKSAQRICGSSMQVKSAHKRKYTHHTHHTHVVDRPMVRICFVFAARPMCDSLCVRKNVCDFCACEYGVVGRNFW